MCLRTWESNGTDRLVIANYQRPMTVREGAPVREFQEVFLEEVKSPWLLKGE